MLQLRAPDKRGKNLWSFWGGTVEKGETNIVALNRELKEEMGILPDIERFYPIHTMTSNDGDFEYHTFLGVVATEFVPVLNNESNGYAWIDHDRYPMPLHFGAKLVLQNPRIMGKIKTIIQSTEK